MGQCLYNKLLLRELKKADLIYNLIMFADDVYRPLSSYGLQCI